MRRNKRYIRLKPPVPVQPVWRGDEPCRRTPDVFHPEMGDNRGAEIAKWICGRCPSKAKCLEWALQDPELMGIVAGTTSRQRSKLRASGR